MKRKKKTNLQERVQSVVDGTVGTRWWRLPKDDDTLANSVSSKVRAIRDDQQWRKSMGRFHARLYDGAVGIFAGSGATHEGGSGEYDPEKLPFNVIRNGIDTLVAMLAKNRPLPQIVTDAATYEQQERAKIMGQAIEGELYRARFWKLRPTILRDACTFGTGIVHVHRTGKRIFVERVLEHQLMVDRADGAGGSPRCMYFVRTVDRFVLAEKFPELKEEILAAPAIDHNEHEFVWLHDSEDRMLVIDAYRLPDNADSVWDGDKPVGGRHVTCIAGVQTPLVDEPWKKPYHPFCFIRKSEPIAGFFGTGVAQEMAGFQAEINLVSDKVQAAHHLMGGGHIFVAQGSEIVDSDITNGVGVIIKYRGQKPEWHSPTPVAPETYGYLQDLGKFALAYSGISPTSAQSVRPPGVTAARALLVLDDIETQRFQVFARADEEWVMDISRQIVDLVDEIVTEDKSYAVKVSEGRKMLKIPWGQYALDKEAYIMQVYPTSLLGRTPAARLQYVQDLFNAKVIDRAMFLKLLDAPDINAEMDLEAAGRACADEQIEWMLKAKPKAKDAYQSPDKYQDLVYALHRCQAQLNHWKMRNLPEFNKKLLIRYLVQARGLLKQALEPPQPPPPLPGTPGGAVPTGAPAQPVTLPGQLAAEPSPGGAG